MNVRRAAAQRQAAKAWWATLGNTERWQIGDALVLGEFDWREWGFEKPPSAAFLREVDEQRIQWEILRGSSEVLP